VKLLRPTHPYIPMARGFLYLVAIIDWASRAVLAWRLSNTIDSRFCVEALEEALERYGKPKIFNTDQGPRAPRSPISWKKQTSPFPWTGAVASWTTFSSNGCGARSSMKRCI
jgi:transposase InsO family protein